MGECKATFANLSRAGGLVAAAILLTACMEMVGVMPDPTPLTCTWLDVPQEGPARTEDGLVPADVAEALDGRTVSAVDTTRGGAVQVSIEAQAPEGTVERVFRRLPPNREVERYVDGIGCLEGDLVTGRSSMAFQLEPDDGPPLRLDVGAGIEGVAMGEEDVAFRFFTRPTPLRDLGPAWRELLEPSVPSGVRPSRVRTWTLGEGTLAEGGITVWLAVEDRYGRLGEPREGMWVAWP